MAAKGVFELIPAAGVNLVGGNSSRFLAFFPTIDNAGAERVFKALLAGEDVRTDCLKAGAPFRIHRTPHALVLLVVDQIEQVAEAFLDGDFVLALGRIKVMSQFVVSDSAPDFERLLFVAHRLQNFRIHHNRNLVLLFRFVGGVSVGDVLTAY